MWNKHHEYIWRMYAVAICAKFHCDQPDMLWTRAFQNFIEFQIWLKYRHCYGHRVCIILTEELYVICHHCYVISDFCSSSCWWYETCHTYLSSMASSQWEHGIILICSPLYSFMITIVNQGSVLSKVIILFMCVICAFINVILVNALIDLLNLYEIV